MKYLFLLLISLNCFAGAFAPLEKEGFDEKSFPKFYEYQDSCEKAEGIACYDIDACPTKFCELVDNYVVDYISQKQYESCTDELDCDAKFSYLKCTKGEEIKNYETLSVYCAVNVMRIEGKKLVESESKKDAYKAARKAEKDAEEAKFAAKKSLKLAIKEDIKTATTVAKLKALIEKLIEAQDEK